MRIKKSDLKTEVSDLRKDEILKKTSPLPQISRKGRAERGCERGSVCKRLPQDFPQTSPGMGIRREASGYGENGGTWGSVREV